MQWDKVKKILTVILLAVNVFLLVNLGIKYIQENQREKETLQNVSVLLSQKNIFLGEDFKMPQNISLPVLSIDRNRVAEEEMALKMLGEDLVQGEDANGDIIFESEKGEITWSADCTVHGVYMLGQTVAEEDLKRKAEMLFDEWGLSEKGSTIQITERIATLNSPVASMPVHNRYIALYFEENGDVQISGYWSFSVPYTTAKGTGVLCAPEDAILSFASEHDDIQKIESIDLGYCLKQENGRKLQLVPTWNIQTEQRKYYVECESGSIFS